MCRPVTHSIRLLVLGLLVSLAAAMLPSDAATASDDGLSSVVDRFATRTDVAWIGTCGGAPLAYVDDVLLGVDLTGEQLDQAADTLSAHLSHTTTEPYGVTAFHLKGKGVDVVAAQADLEAKGVPVDLNHVFFFNPFWQFRPEKAPTEIDDTDTRQRFRQARSRVVVIDTGYPAKAAPPAYDLGLDSYTSIDEGSVTAYHGPFIVSQIEELTGPDRLMLQRVLTEKGLLDPPGPGDEDIFDEVALLATLHETDMTNAIVNLSFGTYGCSNEPPAALQRALTVERDENNAVFVAAAGNDQTQARSFPGAFSEEFNWVHAVGAHAGPSHSKLSTKRACFSNFGSVTVWAPGVDVLGTIPGPKGLELAQASGTSFAAPYVTAALAAGYGPHDRALGLFTNVADSEGGLSRKANACG